MVVNIDPNALPDVDESMLKEMYEASVANNRPQHEDVSDVMVRQPRAGCSFRNSSFPWHFAFLSQIFCDRRKSLASATRSVAPKVVFLSLLFFTFTPLLPDSTSKKTKWF